MYVSYIFRAEQEQRVTKQGSVPEKRKKVDKDKDKDENLKKKLKTTESPIAKSNEDTVQVPKKTKTASKGANCTSIVECDTKYKDVFKKLMVKLSKKDLIKEIFHNDGCLSESDDEKEVETACLENSSVFERYVATDLYNPLGDGQRYPPQEPAIKVLTPKKVREELELEEKRKRDEEKKHKEEEKRKEKERKQVEKNKKLKEKKDAQKVKKTDTKIIDEVQDVDYQELSDVSSVPTREDIEKIINALESDIDLSDSWWQLAKKRAEYFKRMFRSGADPTEEELRFTYKEIMVSRHEFDDTVSKELDAVVKKKLGILPTPPDVGMASENDSDFSTGGKTNDEVLLPVHKATEEEALKEGEKEEEVATKTIATEENKAAEVLITVHKGTEEQALKEGQKEEVATQVAEGNKPAEVLLTVDEATEDEALKEGQKEEEVATPVSTEEKNNDEVLSAVDKEALKEGETESNILKQTEEEEGGESITRRSKRKRNPTTSDEIEKKRSKVGGEASTSKGVGPPNVETDSGAKVSSWLDTNIDVHFLKRIKVGDELLVAFWEMQYPFIVRSVEKKGVSGSYYKKNHSSSFWRISNGKYFVPFADVIKEIQRKPQPVGMDPNLKQKLIEFYEV